MSVENWDWSRRIFDHIDVHATDYDESVRFYETVLEPLGIPKLGESEEGTCFANLNVVDRQPGTQRLHLCFYAREKAHVDAFHEAGVVGTIENVSDQDAILYAAFAIPKGAPLRDTNVQAPSCG